MPWLVITGVLVAALSLRGPIVAPTPVLPAIERDLDVGVAAAGLLTTAPVLMFALLTPVAAVVIRRIVGLWADRRRGGARRLHTRMVLLFSLVAVTPSIMMAVGSGLFFHFGVEAWFNERVRTALHDSLAVARSYLAEHQQVIAGDHEWVERGIV